MVSELMSGYEKFMNGQKDVRTDGGHDIIRPVFGGRIKGVFNVREGSDYPAALTDMMLTCLTDMMLTWTIAHQSIYHC